MVMKHQLLKGLCDQAVQLSKVEVKHRTTWDFSNRFAWSMCGVYLNFLVYYTRIISPRHIETFQRKVKGARDPVCWWQVWVSRFLVSPGRLWSSHLSPTSFTLLRSTTPSPSLFLNHTHFKSKVDWLQYEPKKNAFYMDRAHFVDLQLSTISHCTSTYWGGRDCTWWCPGDIRSSRSYWSKSDDWEFRKPSDFYITCLPKNSEWLLEFTYLWKNQSV